MSIRDIATSFNPRVIEARIQAAVQHAQAMESYYVKENALSMTRKEWELTRNEILNDKIAFMTEKESRELAATA